LIHTWLSGNYQAEAVEKVVEFMNTYSISQEDFDTIVELSKFKVPQLYIALSLYLRVISTSGLIF